MLLMLFSNASFSAGDAVVILDIIAFASVCIGVSGCSGLLGCSVFSFSVSDVGFCTSTSFLHPLIINALRSIEVKTAVVLFISFLHLREFLVIDRKETPNITLLNHYTSYMEIVKNLSVRYGL